MNISRSVTMRQAWGIAASAAVLVLAGWAGTASAAASRPESPQAGSTISSAPTISMCCPGYSSSGLTTSGQASVRGQGTAARDAAITKAVADATDQAKTAANAAGITLGAIIDMQVSSPYFAYPMGVSSSGSEAVASSGSGTAVPVGGALGFPSSGSAPGAPMLPAPAQVQTFASVTITWSIG